MSGKLLLKFQGVCKQLIKLFTRLTRLGSHAAVTLCLWVERRGWQITKVWGSRSQYRERFGDNAINVGVLRAKTAILRLEQNTHRALRVLSLNCSLNDTPHRVRILKVSLFTSAQSSSWVSREWEIKIISTAGALSRSRSGIELILQLKTFECAHS